MKGYDPRKRTTAPLKTKKPRASMTGSTRRPPSKTRGFKSNSRAGWGKKFK